MDYQEHFTDAELGEALRTTSGLQAVVQASTEAPAASQDRSLPGMTPDDHAVLRLLKAAGQNSGLVLDADERSFRLIEAVVFEMPDVLAAAAGVQDVLLGPARWVTCRVMAAASANDRTKCSAICGLNGGSPSGRTSPKGTS